MCFNLHLLFAIGTRLCFLEPMSEPNSFSRQQLFRYFKTLVSLGLLISSFLLQMTLLWIPFPHPLHLPLDKLLSGTSVKRKHGAQNRAHIFQELALEGAGLCVCVCVRGCQAHHLTCSGVRLVSVRPNFKWTFVSGPEMFTHIYLQWTKSL